MRRPRACLLAVLCLCFVIPAHVLGQGELFTPQHVAKLRVVVEAVIAPDGTQVAYVLSVPRDLPREKDGGAWTELHVVDMKGNSSPFITGPVNVGSIAWTPDGKSIAFLTKRDTDSTRSLYVIGTRGGEARRLLAHATDIQSFSFSGDGKQVAFLATEPVGKAKKVHQDQGFNQEVYEEDAQPVRVWIASPDDGKPATMLKLDGSASELAFSPRADKIAVALAPNALIDEHIMFRKVHIVDLKTGKATNLNNPGKLGQFAWSPDGKKLAMITGADKHDPKEGRLWVHQFGKEGWADALPDFPGHVESIGWSSATILSCQAAEGTVTTIGSSRLGPDGTWIPRQTAGFDGVSLAHVTTWLFDDEKISPDDPDLAFVGSSLAHSPEVYVRNTRGIQRLTDSNPWLKNMKFAKQEVVKYKAKDGLELEGVLIRPLNEKSGQRYPLVLTVHGGPEAHYSNGWLTLYHSLGQVAAARGMAVFYPNYRGSTGYGVEFSMKGQREAGGKEFDDLVDGVDHLVKMGLVDAKKVGITGGSYGGYATAWGSTYYSDRFAAGVMFVGISDWISCAGTTDIPQEMFLVHHRKWLWDDWDYFAKASPLKYLDKAKTPLLIVHGKADPRVNPGQSLELYRHLKVRGQAPVRLVLYPGEGHGNRRAASRLDYNLRLLQWMEHYLKGPGDAAPAYEMDYSFAAPAKTTAESSGSRPVRLPRFLEERSGFDDGDVHPFCARRGCPCCIGQ
jgi:dipeptidyl aminopeptidase/acylaminoacyl peptidase